jgi:hypothetical protein
MTVNVSYVKFRKEMFEAYLKFGVFLEKQTRKSLVSITDNAARGSSQMLPE